MCVAAGWPTLEGLRGKTIFRVFGEPSFLKLHEELRPGGQGALLFVEDSISECTPLHGMACLLHCTKSAELALWPAHALTCKALTPGTPWLAATPCPRDAATCAGAHVCARAASLPYVPSNSTVFASADVSLARVYNDTALQQAGIQGALNVAGFSDAQKQVLVSKLVAGRSTIPRDGATHQSTPAASGRPQRHAQP